jgi:hypothetical protein
VGLFTSGVEPDVAAASRSSAARRSRRSSAIVSISSAPAARQIDLLPEPKPRPPKPDPGEGLVAVIRENPGSSANKVIKIAHMANRAALRVIRHLEDAGTIERRGRGLYLREP